MYQVGKAHNAIQEMKRMGIEIMCVGDKRLPGHGKSNVTTVH